MDLLTEEEEEEEKAVEDEDLEPEGQEVNKEPLGSGAMPIGIQL